MMDIPTGKGVMIWQLHECGFGGDMVALVGYLVQKGVTHVSVKVHNGTSITWDRQHTALLPDFIAAAQVSGMHVRGWGFCYGISTTQAAGEAARAVVQVNRFGLSGYDIDAEGGFDKDGMALVAKTLTQLVRTGLPDVSISLCSYRFPSYHPKFPWRAFLDNGVDFHMPQMYWQGSNNPGDQLDQCVTELTLLKNLPIVPVGAAYCEWGWCAQPNEMEEFAYAVETKNLPGYSFWSLQHILQDTGRRKMFESLEWNAPPPPPPDPGFPKAGVTTAAVNFRRYPVVADCTKIRTLPAGAALTITGEDDGSCGYDWWAVVASDGVAGWVAKPFVEVTG